MTNSFCIKGSRASGESVVRIVFETDRPENRSHERNNGIGRRVRSPLLRRPGKH